MTIDSKVVSLSIEHTNIGDFTIDLRKEIPTEFVNVKMMNKLRLENAGKERRITQLESEVLELHERIIEMSLTLEHRSKEPFSETSIPGSMNTISEIKAGRGEGEREYSIAADQMFGDYQAKKNNEKGCEGHYESLLRMIKMQANAIEKYQAVMPKNAQRAEK